MKQHDVDFSLLGEFLPPIVWRSRWNALADKYGLPYRRGYLQNLDAENKGPKRITFNNRIGYKRDDLIDWLNARNRKGL